MSIADQQGRARERNGRFAPTELSEQPVVLQNIDTYEHVENEGEIFRHVQQMVALARRSGQEPEAAGAWLREFDPNESRGLDAA